MRPRAGVSLIELVAVIVVIGVSIPALLTGWADISWRSVQAESLADATSYGQALMEEVLSRRFDEVSVSPWTAAAQFAGGRQDENDENGRQDFDDIDDYQGFNESPAGGYVRSVSVNYMNLSGSSWQQSATVTDYKRVRVSVVRSGRAGANITLESLVAAP